MLRTPGSASNRRTWTLSVWVKRAELGWDGASSYQHIFTADQTYRDALIFDNADKINAYTGRVADGGSSLVTTAVYRDVSNWYHIVWAVDTEQGTPANRSKLYVNGSQVTAFSTETYMSEDWDTYINNTQRHSISYDPLYSRFPFLGYMAEMHFIDGTALTPSSFGEVDGDSGQWKPIEVEGLTYSTNGFYMDFADSGDLGDDESGEGNDYSETNIVAKDQMTDSPTNNWAVPNRSEAFESESISSYAEGNMQVAFNNDARFYGWTPSSIGMVSGKWYCEAHVTFTTASLLLGIVGRGWWPPRSATNYIGGHFDTYGWNKTYGIVNDNSNNSYDSITPASGNVLGIALDLDNHKLYFHKAGVYLNSGDPTNPGGGTGFSISAASTTTNGAYQFAFGTYGESVTFTVNYGQEGTFAGLVTAGNNADDNGYGNFLYDVPAGFLALCSKNLPDCAVTPSEHFSANIWSGNSTDDTAITTGFQPDLVWIKCRSDASHNHSIYDSLRGVGKRLKANNNTVEQTYTDTMMAFTSTGFEVDDDASIEETNKTGKTYVGWSWKAGGSGSSNEDGTINTTATSVNTSAGFSISTYTGNGVAGATVGHGLSKAPNLVMVKRRTDAISNWQVGSIQTMASLDFTDYLMLDTFNAFDDSADFWNDTAPTASVFSLGTQAANNADTMTYVAYCFHSVEGYSQVGSYRGSGITGIGGAFIYTGFSPAFLMIKRIDATSKNWLMYDRARDPENDGAFRRLNANDSAAEDGGPEMDWLSNGFKTNTTNSEMNYSTGPFLYLAFSSVPFKNSNAV